MDVYRCEINDEVAEIGEQLTRKLRAPQSFLKTCDDRTHQPSAGKNAAYNGDMFRVLAANQELRSSLLSTVIGNENVDLRARCRLVRKLRRNQGNLQKMYEILIPPVC